MSTETNAVPINGQGYDLDAPIEDTEACTPKWANDGNGFWEAIIGLGDSGDHTLAERDEEILSENVDPIRGWGSPF